MKFVQKIGWTLLISGILGYLFCLAVFIITNMIHKSFGGIIALAEKGVVAFFFLITGGGIIMVGYCLAKKGLPNAGGKSPHVLTRYFDGPLK